MLRDFEHKIQNHESINRVYFQGLLSMIAEDEFYPDDVRIEVIALKNEASNMDGASLLWRCNSVRHGLLSCINGEPADWDWDVNTTGNRRERTVGEWYLFLDGLRSPFNVGSIFRSAESFGIKKIFLSKDSTSPEHNRAKRSSMGCTELLPWAFASLEELPKPLFALEVEGKSVEQFSFPQTGCLIIGSEELGVSPAGRKAADWGLGRLSIATGGIKGSLNVSVATGIALQKWYSSILQKANTSSK